MTVQDDLTGREAGARRHYAALLAQPAATPQLAHAAEGYRQAAAELCAHEEAVFAMERCEAEGMLPRDVRDLCIAALDTRRYDDARALLAMAAPPSWKPWEVTPLGDGEAPPLYQVREVLAVSAGRNSGVAATIDYYPGHLRPIRETVVVRSWPASSLDRAGCPLALSIAKDLPAAWNPDDRRALASRIADAHASWRLAGLRALDGRATALSPVEVVTRAGGLEDWGRVAAYVSRLPLARQCDCANAVAKLYPTVENSERASALLVQLAAQPHLHVN